MASKKANSSYELPVGKVGLQKSDTLVLELKTYLIPPTISWKEGPEVQIKS